MDHTIDRASFVATIAVILLVSVPLFVAPEAGGIFLQECYDFVAENFGVLYSIGGCGALGLLLWLALGKNGKIKLGQENDRPEFSTYSWVGMLFCAGVGAGLMYWSSIEWAFYYQSPPFDVAARTPEAVKWASAYGIFHWGITAWAFYCLPTIAIAYPYYVHRVPILKLSVSCHFFLKGREEHIGARIIDFLFMLALIGGAGSSLGFSTPLIAELISRLTGFESTFALEVLVVLLCVVLFTFSVYLGLERGIKRLSNLNVLLALGLIVFVFIAGPTRFMLKTAITSTGTVAQYFIQMNTWSDPFSESKFFTNWTVFYWAWWIAYGPFVGLFVTRISRGRTLREVILGMLFFGSLGAALFYLSLGSFSLHQQLSGNVEVIDILNEQNGNRAIIASFEQLPMAPAFMALFCLVSLIFSATTYDSASYTLASNATRRLLPGEDPPRWHRCFWSVALAVLPISLMYVGGLKVAQTAVLISSLPILFVGVLMSVSLIKTLKQDQRVSSVE